MLDLLTDENKITEFNEERDKKYYPTKGVIEFNDPKI